MWQRRRNAGCRSGRLRPPWGPRPGISDQWEREVQPQTEAPGLDPRCAWPGQGRRARRSPVLFEKLVRLSKAVIEQHVDAGQGQLRVLEGRRRRRISVVPPPRPPLLGAGHGSAGPCAGPRRGGVAAAAGPSRARSPALPALSAAEPGGGAGRGAEGGAGPAAARRGAWAPRPPPPASRRRGGLLSSRPPAPPAPLETPGSRGHRS